MKPILRVVGGPGAGDDTTISKSPFVIGRDESCHFTIDVSGVSRRHCAVFVAKGQFVIRDLKSRNGTQVNGQPLQRDRILKPRDKIKIDKVELEFLLGEPEQAEPATREDAIESSTVAVKRTSQTTIIRSSGESTSGGSTENQRHFLRIMGKQPFEEIEVKDKSFLIGRLDSCDYTVDSNRVSRNHCRIELTRLGMTVSDLDSRNGTFVNGALLEFEKELRDGDVLRVGDAELQVVVRSTDSSGGDDFNGLEDPESVLAADAEEGSSIASDWGAEMTAELTKLGHKPSKKKKPNDELRKRIWR